MGLFHKKEACPVCGGEVKGLFHKKIGGKKALCKDCSAQVSMAKELLKNTDWNNEIVSDKLGYASSGYFIKLFKKTFGMTPREFRKASGI